MPDCLQTVMPDCLVMSNCLQTYNHAWLPRHNHVWLVFRHTTMPDCQQTVMLTVNRQSCWLPRHSHAWLPTDSHAWLPTDTVMPENLHTQSCLTADRHHSHVRLPRHTVMVDCLQTHSHLQSIIIFFSAIKMIKPSKYQYNILLVL